MKLIDALHIATALQAGCQYLITRDNGFKQVEDVKIMQLKDLMESQ